MRMGKWEADCSVCGGSGIVLKWTKPGEWRENKWVTCSKCGGTGRVRL